MPLRFLRKVRQDEEGANVAPYAIAFPFVLMLIFGFIEAGMIMLRWIMLERGVDLASRELRLNGTANADLDAYLDEAMGLQQQYMDLLQSEFELNGTPFTYTPYERDSDEAENVANHNYIKDLVCAEAEASSFAKEGSNSLACENTLRISLTPVDSTTGLPSSDLQCVDRTGPVEPILDLPNIDPGLRNVADAKNIMYMRVCLVIDPIFPAGWILPFETDGSGGLIIAVDSAYINEPE